jgi:DNA-binding transcriptional MerR regulator/mannose-6-phosphate isomerase-like protein (cupin superfamily)
LKKIHKNGSINLSSANGNNAGGYLKIGDVARRIGVSASVIRSWERLGMIRPDRTDSQYRLYSKEQLEVLKHARFLRRVRGLNGPAIVEMLKTKGLVRPSRNNVSAAVGTRLRQLRATLGLSLAEVAEAVGISVGFLSAIERSHMSASVGTLRKLARYYKLNILDFFDATAEASPHLVRLRERKRLNAGSGVRMDLLAWGNTVMEPHLFTIAPGAGSGESYAHEGEEFVFVLRGTLNISLEGQEYLLKSGDSFYFESSTPHTWCNSGKSQTVLLWVNTPPTF